MFRFIRYITVVPSVTGSLLTGTGEHSLEYRHLRLALQMDLEIDKDIDPEIRNKESKRRKCESLVGLVVSSICCAPPMMARITCKKYSIC